MRRLNITLLSLLLAGCGVYTEGPDRSKITLSPDSRLWIAPHELDRYQCPADMALECGNGTRVALFCRCVYSR